MEKNLPDQDPFEEYIRRTFDDLDEEPSAEMWSKIDGELRPIGRKPVGLALFFRQNRWLMAASLAGLLAGGMFGWQLGRSSKEENSGASLVEKPAEKRSENSSHKFDEEKKISSQKNDERVGQSTSTDRKSDEKFQPMLASPPTTSQPLVGKDANNGQTSNQGAEPVVGEDANNGQNSTPVLNRLAILEMLSTKPSFAVFSSQIQAPVFLKIQPELASQKSPDYFATAWLMPVRTHEKPRGITRPSGPIGRPLFVNRPPKESISAEIGLSAGKKWGNGFVFETGLSLRSEQSRATHEATFKFSESTAGQAGSRQFDYDLTTYGGSASVSYRVEEVNPGSQIGPTEEVGLQISTIERVKTLRIPLLFGFQKQVGRWQIGFKTGPVAQFLLKNELEIESGKSAHPRLRAIAGRSGWAISQQSSQHFRAGFQNAATVGFRVSEKIGLSVEPTFMGDFGSRVAATGRLPERFSTGVKLGATVCF